MKWKTETGPEKGEERVVRYFAFWPTQLSNGYTVWLERYWAVERWEYIHTDVSSSYWRLVRTYSND